MMTQPPSTGISLDLGPPEPFSGPEDQTLITVTSDALSSEQESNAGLDLSNPSLVAPTEHNELVTNDGSSVIQQSTTLRTLLIMLGILTAAITIEAFIFAEESIILAVLDETFDIGLLEEPLDDDESSSSDSVAAIQDTNTNLRPESEPVVEDLPLKSIAPIVTTADNLLAEVNTEEFATSSNEDTLTNTTKIHPNPYWALPNEVDKLPPLARIWTAAEEARWRADIVHRYGWRRYKTVVEVHTSRLTGSDVILWDALHDEKFWVRFQALAALADFGVTITTRMVKDAIADTRPALVTRFIKRYRLQPTIGELYMLRQALRIVPSWQARYQILTIIKKHHMNDNELYLAAATHDTQATIQRLGKRAMRYFPTDYAATTQKRLTELMQKPVLDLDEQAGLRQPSTNSVDPQAPRSEPKSEIPDPFNIEDVEMYQVDWQK